MGIDLIPLFMAHCYVIIGMDWLSKFKAKIDCVSKSITFEEPKGGEMKLEGEKVIVPPCFISVSKARQLLKKGCQGYLCSISTISEGLVAEVPIVRDFIDVFSEELPGMPIDREINFCIDIIPKAQPASKIPYRMATAELKELKIQLQELLDKNFI